jgi:Ca2+-binding EF-hand superfamily protein
MEDESENKWKEVWKLYDLDKDDKVTREEFYAAVRVCGRRYTQEQMTEKTKNFGNTISYDTFFGFMCDPYTGPTPDDLKNALRAFDGKDSGELTIAQLQALLTTMGDKLPLETVKPLLDSVPQHNGRVAIAALAEFLTPPIPNANPNVPELMRELMREETAKAGIPMYEMRKDAPLSPPAAGNSPRGMEIPEAHEVESVGSSH